ncbi:MAG: hypothetical protein ACR2MX_13960, partial [Cyclobacteriaceae bacterium]
MKKLHYYSLLLIMVPLILIDGYGQRKARNAVSTPSLLSDSTFAGLKFRSIGPAFKSGRIADIAIHPEDDNQWYVAVGSGGVWKTKNAG